MPPLITIITEDGPPGWGASGVTAAVAGLVGRSVQVWRVSAAGVSAAIREAPGRFVLHVPATERVFEQFLAAAVERLSRDDAPDVLAGASRWIDESGATVFEARPPEPFSLGELLRLRTRWFDGRCVLAAGTVVRANLEPAQRPSSMEIGTGAFGVLVGAAVVGARMQSIDLTAAEALVPSIRPDDANLRTVRAMLPVCRWALAAGASRLGEDAGAARDEVASVAERAEFVEVVCERWNPPLVTPSFRDKDQHGSPAAYAELVAETGDGWLDQACAMALPHLRLAAEAARQELPRLRRARVLWVCRSGGAGAAAFLSALGLRRIEATVLVQGERMRERAERRLGAHRSWSRTIRCIAAEDWADPSLHGGTNRKSDPVAGPFDLIACENVLTTSPRPEEQLRRWASLLAPRGMLMLAGEPREPRVLAPYMRALTRRLCDQVTLRTKMRLDPEADAHLSAIRREEDRAPGLWASAHPFPRGVDAPAIIAGLGGFDPVMRRSYGSLWFHPLTPFPFVEGTGVEQDDAWTVGLWRKSAAAGMASTSKAAATVDERRHA